MPGAHAKLTVAVCAYNEEANIGHLLQAVLRADPQGHLIDDVLVVSSGSTDRTDDIVRKFCLREPRLRLLAEEGRLGKLSAVNTVLGEARNDYIILADADCLPAEGSIELLAQALVQEGIGGAGTRNVPVNASDSLASRIAALMWEMHHMVNLRHPVLGGDIVAFRRVMDALPATSGINDDFIIECELRRRGYRIAYEPQAITYMRVPTSLADFLRQRRRIHYGFRREGHSFGAIKATERPGNIIAAAARLLRYKPYLLPILAMLVGLEAWARLSAFWDAIRGAPPGVGRRAWEIALTTKGAITSSRQNRN